MNSVGLVEMFTRLDMTEEIRQDPTKVMMIFVVPKGMGATYQKQGLTSKAGDNWECADVTLVNGISRDGKQRLNALGIKTCKDLLDTYKTDPDSIKFVGAVTKAFRKQTDADYLDKIPQFVMELEE